MELKVCLQVCSIKVNICAKGVNAIDFFMKYNVLIVISR